VDLFISTEKIMVLNTDLKVRVTKTLLRGIYFGTANELQALAVVQLLKNLSCGA
jgi:hypothetical protein